MSARRRSVFAATFLVLGSTAAGCTMSGEATPTDSKPNTSPPSSQQVSLKGVDPCSLLTSPQKRELGLRDSAQPTKDAARKQPSCTFAPMNSADRFDITLDTQTGLEYWDDKYAPHQPTQVDEFKAVEVRSIGCTVAVGVAEKQELVVGFNKQSEQTMQTECDKVTKYAKAALVTLKSLKGGG